MFPLTPHISSLTPYVSSLPPVSSLTTDVSSLPPHVSFLTHVSSLPPHISFLTYVSSFKIYLQGKKSFLLFKKCGCIEQKQMNLTFLLLTRQNNQTS